MDQRGDVFVVFGWSCFHDTLISYANICLKDGIMLRKVLKINSTLTK